MSFIEGQRVRFIGSDDDALSIGIGPNRPGATGVIRPLQSGDADARRVRVDFDNDVPPSGYTYWVYERMLEPVFREGMQVRWDGRGRNSVPPQCVEIVGTLDRYNPEYYRRAGTETGIRHGAWRVRFPGNGSWWCYEDTLTPVEEEPTYEPGSRFLWTKVRRPYEGADGVAEGELYDDYLVDAGAPREFRVAAEHSDSRKVWGHFEQEIDPVARTWVWKADLSPVERKEEVVSFTDVESLKKHVQEVIGKWATEEAEKRAWCSEIDDFLVGLSSDLGFEVSRRKKVRHLLVEIPDDGDNFHNHVYRRNHRILSDDLVFPSS